MIKIDKGVQIPKKQSRKLKYPFPDMKVGDSFEVQDAAKKNTIVSAAKGWCERNQPKWDFSVRTIDGKFRLWRTK